MPFIKAFILNLNSQTENKSMDIRFEAKKLAYISTLLITTKQKNALGFNMGIRLVVSSPLLFLIKTKWNVASHFQ